jgi:hypothetical protein
VENRKTLGPQPNPATRAESPQNVAVAARKRVPMSVPRQKLQVPDLPGYKLYWATESTIHQFLEAGYEFVNSSEVMVNYTGIGSEATITGNQDLGSRIRIGCGTREDGSPEYHVLMKIREEWWREDKAIKRQYDANRLASIFTKEHILGAEDDSPGDRAQRYVDTDRTSIRTSGRGTKSLFQRPMPKKI